MTPTSDSAAEFCERLRGRLVGSLTLYCGERAVAEELAQEALARAWQRWGTVSQMESPEAWTYRTALNLARSRFRRRAAERRANERHARNGPTAVVPGDADDAAGSLAVREAVADLPPRQRAVIVARYYLGLDVAQTAAALDCAEGTVKASTSAAIRNLRTAGLLDDEHAPEPEVDRR